MKAAALPGLVRPFTLLAPAVGVVAGAVVARAATGRPWSPGRVALGVLAALLATAASNAWNQAFDADVDRINKPGRPIPAGLATPRGALLLGHGTALAGAVAAFLAAPWFFVCVSAGLLGTWIYSAPPLRAKRHPLGALLTIAIPRGVLVPVAGWALLSSPDAADPWALGAVAGLFVLGAAGTKDFADVEGDRAHGCRTLPVLLGPRRAARIVAPFLVLPFLLYPLAGAVGWLRPGVGALALLGGALSAVGLGAALLLLRDPQALARRGGNHPAWVLMYLQLLGAHVGAAVVYGAWAA